MEARDKLTDQERVEKILEKVAKEKESGVWTNGREELVEYLYKDAVKNHKDATERKESESKIFNPEDFTAKELSIAAGINIDEARRKVKALYRARLIEQPSPPKSFGGKKGSLSARYKTLDGVNTGTTS